MVANSTADPNAALSVNYISEAKGQFVSRVLCVCARECVGVCAPLAAQRSGVAGAEWYTGAHGPTGLQPSRERQ